MSTLTEIRDQELVYRSQAAEVARVAAQEAFISQLSKPLRNPNMILCGAVSAGIISIAATSIVLMPLILDKFF